LTTSTEGAPQLSLHVISLGGTEVGLLAAGVDADATLSHDGTRIAFFTHEGLWETGISILDLRDGSRLDLPGTFPNSVTHEWSPDGNYLAVSSDDGVSIVTIPEGHRSLLLNCEQAHLDTAAVCEVTSWSPDGRWLTYQMGIFRSGYPDPRQGAYAVPLGYPGEATTCPVVVGPPVKLPGRVVQWSPDSRYVLLGLPGRVAFFDVRSWSIASERLLAADPYLIWTPRAWSPGAERVAYNMHEELWIVSPWSGESSLLFSGPDGEELPLFWLTVQGRDP
jgi:Tol biopolymer transport system component